MSQREFGILVGNAVAVSRTLAAKAQQAQLPVIGFLSSTSSLRSDAGFPNKAMSRVGMIEEFRSAGGRFERVPANDNALQETVRKGPPLL